MAVRTDYYSTISSSLDRDFHAKKLFKQAMKNRYLGDVETKHHRLIAGHSLSFPTYQFNGCPSPQTITYRPKTTEEIIRKEHQKFHIFCSKSASESLRSPRRNNAFRSKRSDQTFIAVTGETASRPSTAFVSGSTGTTNLHVLNTPRSQTSWNLKSSVSAPNISRSNSEKQLKLDAEYMQKKHLCEETKSRISNHRRPQSHTLKIGAHNREPSGESSDSQQWLTFGGGVKNSAGMIEAFTVMKNPEEYYSIDGSTGTVIAKQLRKQDKISIGVNGKPLTKKAHDNDDLDLSAFDFYDSDICIRPSMLKVPLCWNDQFDEDEATPVKILEPSTPRQQVKKPNLCENHPVVFNKLIHGSSSGKTKAAVKAKPPPGGFSVKHRNRPHKDLTGNETSLTVISIEPNAQQDAERENVNYSSILEYAVVGQPRSQNFEWEKKYKDFREIKDYNHTHFNGRKETMSARSSKSATSEKNKSEPKFIVKPTPSTPPSNRDDLYVTGPGNSKRVASPAGSNKSHSSKPQSGKLIRGRSNVGMNAPPSIRNDYNQGDTSYIKINKSYFKPDDKEDSITSITVLSVTENAVIDNMSNIEGHKYYLPPEARANSPVSDDQDDVTEVQAKAPPNTHRDEPDEIVDVSLNNLDNITQEFPVKEVKFVDNLKTSSKDLGDDIATEPEEEFAISVSIKPKFDLDESNSD